MYTLARQCSKVGIPYQILCFDDGSQQKFKELNRELGEKMHINYTEMPENLGRSRIRNWLGKLARFDYILFLDGDSTIKSANFIKTYLNLLPTSAVIYGGRAYSLRKPAKKKRLHWEYGRKREALPAGKRAKQPYLTFQSNNFLVPSQVFLELPFDNAVEGYGYEDLLYAEELRKKGISVQHIHNPVIHDGLETNAVFLKKTQQAMENLAKLYRDRKLPATRLTLAYERLSRLHLAPLLMQLMTRYAKNIQANLSSEKPSIFLFNLWKMHTFIQNLTHASYFTKK